MKNSFVQVIIGVIILAVITGYLAHIGSMAVVVSGSLLLFSVLAAPYLAGFLDSFDKG